MALKPLAAFMPLETSSEFATFGAWDISEVPKAAIIKEQGYRKSTGNYMGDYEVTV